MAVAVSKIMRHEPSILVERHHSRSVTSTDLRSRWLTGYPPDDASRHLDREQSPQGAAQHLTTLATGVIAVTPVFHKDIIGTSPDSDGFWLLAAGWALLIVFLAAGIWHLRKWEDFYLAHRDTAKAVWAHHVAGDDDGKTEAAAEWHKGRRATGPVAPWRDCEASDHRPKSRRRCSTMRTTLKFSATRASALKPCRKSGPLPPKRTSTPRSRDMPSSALRPA
jgi:hypothetical protein